MPATTRSRTKGNTGAPPSKPLSLPPVPPRRNTKAGLEQAAKVSSSAREVGAGILEALRDGQNQEIEDALGGEGNSRGQSRGRGRGRGRGCGRGGRGRGHRRGDEKDEEISLTVSDAVDTLETDGPNGDPSVPIQATLNEMQLDAAELEAEMGGVSNDGLDLDANCTDDQIQPDTVSTRKGDDSDQEYEPWDGFSSDRTREPKDVRGGPKGLLKLRASTKPKAQKTSAGIVGKRKATPVLEIPRKRVASGRPRTTEPSDMDEVTSQPGGFADEEDGRSITADRTEIINQKKISRRTATGAVSIVHSNTPKPKVVDARKIGNVPLPYKEKFDTDFIPSVVEWVAQSEEPWNNPDGKVPLQQIHDKVYKTIDGIIDRHHPLIEPLKSKLTAWRVAIRKRAQKIVDEHLNNEENIHPASSVREYVGWLKPAAESEDSQDAPFMFSTGLEYKAEMLQGKYLNPLLFETFAAHFGSSGVSNDPMDYINSPPIGAFALTISAVERALEGWKFGKPGQAREFSRGNWGFSTDEYINGLTKISEARWIQILEGTQEFTPYKPREPTAAPEYIENYRTKAPESDVEG
ncbi:hypothetical protein BJ322DRAFT_1110668 [Thelephora terrestris]|uniref:DUF6532 domain-containing protein n=1 Tax=Thelephora terrestris TaxID=56493 RepID=A0A9P6HBS5_9AGAM|nr:hypothetical protein BJ322DRAFT_1110668 [Thelephora terrestris]